MTSGILSCSLVVLACALGLVVVVVRGQYGSQIGCMSDDCNGKLDGLLRMYEYATQEENGCTASCQSECYEVLEEALKAKDSYSCPSYESVWTCMKVRESAWSEFLKECPLLKVASSEAEAEAEAEAGAPSAGESEAEAEAEAEAPSTGESEAEAEAEAEAPSTGESEAEAEAPSSGESEAEAEAPSTGESEAEAEAPSSGESEAEAEAPSSGESEAEAEAPSSGESEAEAASPSSGESEAEAASPSSGESEAEGECSAASSEAEGESDGMGCWPDFDDYDQLDRFIQGAYYSTVFAAPSNTVGIILSVFFWLGLAGTGAWLGRTKK